MKADKQNRIIQTSILLVLAVLMLLSLALPQLNNLRIKAEPLQISVIVRSNDSSLWSIARTGMEEAAYEMGADLRFLTPSKNSDAAEQEELLLRELEHGADALVIVPADAEELGLVLAKQNIGNVVVTMESQLEGSEFVGVDNAKLGKELAQELVPSLEKGSTVLLLYERFSGSGLFQRGQAGAKVLQEAGMKVILPGFSQTASTALKTAMNKEQKIDAVLAFDVDATNAAAVVLKEVEEAPILYGVGTASAVVAQLEKGTIACIAAWSDYVAGYLAVRQAVAAAGGKKPAPTSMDFSIIRKGDIYEPENQKLLFPLVS